MSVLYAIVFFLAFQEAFAFFPKYKSGYVGINADGSDEGEDDRRNCIESTTRKNSTPRKKRASNDNLKEDSQKKIKLSDKVTRRYINRRGQEVIAKPLKVCTQTAGECAHKGMPKCELDEYNRRAYCEFIYNGNKIKGTPADCNIKLIPEEGYLKCDDIGHIMAKKFGGKGERGNTVPMSRCINHGGYLEMEKRVEQLGAARVEIEFVYDNDTSRRPSIIKHTIINTSGKIEIEEKTTTLINYMCET